MYTLQWTKHELVDPHWHGLAQPADGSDFVEQVYMYHGAAFPVLANIIDEGFDLAACNPLDGGVYVSNVR
jgi:hypothetical protein